jgi:hypothetical protein
MRITLKGTYFFYRDLEIEVVGMLKQATRFVMEKVLYVFLSRGSIRNPVQ